jgi:hypothetical protein
MCLAGNSRDLAGRCAREQAQPRTQVLQQHQEACQYSVLLTYESDKSSSSVFLMILQRAHSLHVVCPYLNRAQ